MVYEDTLYRYANYERTHCSGHERVPLHNVSPYITYLQNKSKDQSRKQIKKKLKIFTILLCSQCTVLSAYFDLFISLLWFY